MANYPKLSDIVKLVVDYNTNVNDPICLTLTINTKASNIKFTEDDPGKRERREKLHAEIMEYATQHPEEVSLRRLSAIVHKPVGLVAKYLAQLNDLTISHFAQLSKNILFINIKNLMEDEAQRDPEHRLSEDLSVYEEYIAKMNAPKPITPVEE